MRDWTKLLLIVCVVALGAEVVRLEMRMSGLEADRNVATAGQPQVAVIPPQETGLSPERRPSGNINGIPYYFTPLGRSGG